MSRAWQLCTGSIMMDAVLAFRCHSCVFRVIGGSIPETLSPPGRNLLMEQIKQKRRVKEKPSIMDDVSERAENT